MLTKEPVLEGDQQVEEMSEADADALLKRLRAHRQPNPAWVADRLARRDRRIRSGRRISDLTSAEIWGELVPIGGGASSVTVTLDTTGPASPTISINSGAVYATTQSVTVTIGTSDSPTTSYQMKVYGDVDTGADANVQATKAASTWISYATSKAITLSSGDGSKTVKVTIRDDVWNESSEATDSITLDTTLPTVAVQSGPTPSKISKVTGKEDSVFVWQSDQQYDAYKVKVVASSGAAHSTGTQIPTTAGSSNVSGSTADQPAATNVTTTIKGADLETADAGDGAKIIKVFVQDDSGTWSA